MLHWALVFFMIAVIAALLGLRGASGSSANVGYTYAFIAIVVFVFVMLRGALPVPGP